MSATTTQAKHPGGRPKKAEADRRCKQTNTRWTIAEDRHLRRQAHAAGLSVGEFIRRRALGLPVTPPPPRTDARLLYELNAIGVNLNQIARNLNSDREGASPVDLSNLRSRLQRVLKRVAESYYDD